jgi:hypothetical protein
LVSEFDLPRGSQPREQGIPTDTESKERESHQDDYDAEELQKARSSGFTGSNRQRSHLRKPKADKGIRAFNMARAESLGGGRPIGITIERPNSTGRVKGRGKRKGGGKSEEDEEGEGEGKSEEDEEGEGEGEGKSEEDEEGEEEGEGKSEEDEEGEGNRNPVSIRLDLNLEIEVFLRTKIKGSVTITFL